MERIITVAIIAYAPLIAAGFILICLAPKIIKEYRAEKRVNKKLKRRLS